LVLDIVGYLLIGAWPATSPVVSNFLSLDARVPLIERAFDENQRAIARTGGGGIKSEMTGFEDTGVVSGTFPA
jgi:hypothetical protein